MLQSNRRRSILRLMLWAMIGCCVWTGQCLGQGYNRNYRSQQSSNRHSMNYQNAPGFVVGGSGAVGTNGGAAASLGGGLSHVQSATERRYTGGEMLKFLNVEQDPCSDFYDYACGKWLQNQNVSDARDGDVITVFGLLERKVVQQLQRRLDDATRNPHPVVNKFYRSCLSTNWNEEKLFIKRFVASYGGLPDVKDTWRERAYQWIEILARLKLDFNLDILIAFSMAPNGRPVLREPSTTIMPAELCNAEASPQIDEQDEIFETIQMEIKEKLQLWFDFGDGDANRLAGDIQRFEFDLCKFMRKADIMAIKTDEEEEEEDGEREEADSGRPPPLTNYGPRRQGRSPIPPHLHSKQRLLELETNQKLINFVQLCMGQPQGQGRTDFQIISPEYLQYLTGISGRKPSFANYIMYRALSELTLPQMDRKPHCVRKVMQMFPEYMGSLYQMSIPAQTREFVKQDVASIFRDIKEAIPRSLRKSIDSLQISEPSYQSGVVGGVDPQTYAGIKTNGNYWEILKSITLNNVQQQQALLTPPTQRGRQSAPILASNVVEAFATHLGSNEKIVQFGWGLLQPPFYAYNYPKSLKYSSLGFAIARQLIKHHLDEQNANDRGATTRQPYSAQLDEFLSQRECFRAQMSSYFFNTPDVFRNASQLSEFMADATALSVAFTAYNNWLDKQEAFNPDLKFETLPKMNFSNTQLFFINFAQISCAERFSEEPTAEPSECCPLDLHTPERLRINGPLSNDEEFGLDFNCPIGADLNVADKCSILGNEFKRSY